MKYLITESKINDLIKKFILEEFPNVYSVKFYPTSVTLGSSEGFPSIVRTEIVVVIDNIDDRLNRSQLWDLRHKIQDSVDKVFGLNTEKYGSEWGFKFFQLSIRSIT